MCGIAGILSLHESLPAQEAVIRQMLGMIRHRGPDQFGIYLDDCVGLGNARLSIIDLSGGQQPVSNEDGTLWIVFNGEIFNYIELRPDLEARGHRFATDSDTEVLLHLFEEYGPDCLSRLNGQFAFAVWNTRDRSLFVARDRLGVRPLFYAQTQSELLFGSEVKSLLATGKVSPDVDPVSLDRIFTYWSPLPPRTIFRDIRELPPGHWLRVRRGNLEVHRYWQVDFQEEPASAIREEQAQEELASLLIDAVKVRLRADVPVGAYLSGGLDSSLIASIVRQHATNRLDTFSIAFDDARFDESGFQRRMAESLGTEHQVLKVTHTDIGRVFPEVIWHTETPLMRTGPAPMFLLSGLVRERGYKVVLTGEGADEFLAGYDIFKEAALRRFWARQPESKCRPQLFQRLYRDIPEFGRMSGTLLSSFYREGLTDTSAPEYSHAVRWRNTARARRFFSEELKSAASQNTSTEPPIDYPVPYPTWRPLQRAQYLEIATFLSPYLLASQGDRVAMAHSVEGRFPFLDYRVVEFCNRLPASFKLRGLTEKYLLKRLGRRWLPSEIWKRPKRPYRAPIHRSFFHDGAPEYVREMLSSDRIRQAGFFKADAVSALVRKIGHHVQIGETDDMALAGILSAQLWHERFVRAFERRSPVSDSEDIKVCDKRSP